MHHTAVITPHPGCPSYPVLSGVSIALPPSDIWRIFFEGVLVTKAPILPPTRRPCWFCVVRRTVLGVSPSRPARAGLEHAQTGETAPLLRPPLLNPERRRRGGGCRLRRRTAKPHLEPPDDVVPNLFWLTYPLVYVLPCQATEPPAHREGGAQRSLPPHHAPTTGRTASRLAGSSPALRLNVFIIVLPVGSTAINGRSTDYLGGRSVFLMSDE
jgi:hypothetical protein